MAAMHVRASMCACARAGVGQSVRAHVCMRASMSSFVCCWLLGLLPPAVMPPGGCGWVLRGVIASTCSLSVSLQQRGSKKRMSGSLMLLQAVSSSGMCSASFYFAYTPGDSRSLHCIPEQQMGPFIANSAASTVGISHCLTKATRSAISAIVRERGFSASFYISTAYTQAVTRSPLGPLPDDDFDVFPLDLLSIPGYGQAFEVPSQRWQPAPNPAHLLIVSW